MEKITEEEIISEFDNNTPIWLKSDSWHYYTRKQIENFLSRHSCLIRDAKEVVNAGSSGESYGIPDEKTLHLDLIKSRINNKPRYLVANLEKIPIQIPSFDLIICVGSTINYTNATLVIREFERILKKGGHLFLEFECSNTLELLFTKRFNNSAAFIRTFYRGSETKIWYYSEEWVTRLLTEYGFTIVKQDKWHIISPLILKITGSPNFSSLFSIFDRFFKKVYPFKKFSSNVIMLAIKN